MLEADIPNEQEYFDSYGLTPERLALAKSDAYARYIRMPNEYHLASSWRLQMHFSLEKSQLSRLQPLYLKLTLSNGFEL
jgi:hypothetical protein